MRSVEVVLTVLVVVLFIVGKLPLSSPLSQPELLPTGNG